MNAGELTNLKNTCANISDNIHALFPNLELHILLTTPDKKDDAVASVIPKINGHAAAREALQVLKSWAFAGKGTSFLGLSQGQESIVFSFKTRAKTLAFIAVDITLYKELFEVIQAIHFEIAVFLDTYSQHLKRQMEHNGNVFANRSSPLKICRTNLKADIYSVLQLLREGQYDVPLQIAKERSLKVLSPQTDNNPEEYAFPIALDVVRYTIENQISSKIAARNSSHLLSQYHLAEKIASCFDDENLQSWIQFANSSQMMAWRGLTPSEILGAAVHTATNPFMKAIGHMLSEVSNLAPVEEAHLPIGYNPFIAEEINRIIHERMVEETFEMIMYHVMEADSHLPLLRVANNQNEALLKGKISGWCANALHAAAKAYISAKERGIPPIQAARLEFQSTYLKSNWNLLKDCSKYVFEINRKGATLQLNELLEWVLKYPDSKHMSNSIYITISDPQYADNRPSIDEQIPIENLLLKKIDSDKLLEKLEKNSQNIRIKKDMTDSPSSTAKESNGFAFESENE